MKKLFASLLAATMVAGMAVSAFAETPDLITGTTPDIEKHYMTEDDFTLYKQAYYDDNAVNDGDEVFGGNSIYYPIVFVDEDDNNTPKFATKMGDIDGLKARVKVTMGKEYVEKDAKIVKVDPDKAEAQPDDFTEKIYCVEIRLNDYFKAVDSEVEVEVSLYDKGKKQMTTEDDKISTKAPATTFTLGFEPDDLDVRVTTKDGKDIPAKSVTDSGVEIKKTKDKDGAIELKVNKDTKAVALKKYINKDADEIDIEEITLLQGKGAPNFEFYVKASEQDALWLEVNADSDKEIVKANENAEIDFFNFPGNPEFDFTGDLKLFVEDTDKTYFCYEIKDGKVSPAGKYNAEDECFEIRTRALGSYALSDKELVNAATAETEKPADKPAEEKPADKVVPSGALA